MQDETLEKTQTLPCMKSIIRVSALGKIHLNGNKVSNFGV